MSTQASAGTSSREWNRPLAGLVLLAAAALPLYAGRLGLFPMDQSIVFDGGYRVYCGQVPFRDFMAPYGPVTFWLQALMFHLCGVNFWAAVVGASVLNVVGTAAAVGILRLLVPAHPRLIALGGLITAVWLYAPFGTLYPEQTAFTFILLALWSYLWATEAVEGGGMLRRLSAVAAGVCFGLAVLTKQNAGLSAAGLGVVVAGLRFEARRRPATSIGCAVAGCLAVGGAFGLWLVTQSDVRAFAEHVLHIPSQIGRERFLAGGYVRLIAALLGGKGNDLLRIFFCDFAILAALATAWNVLNRDRLAGSLLGRCTAPVMCCALVGYQNFFSASSCNDGANEKPFFGLIVALCWSLLSTVGRQAVRPASDDRPWRRLPIAVAAVPAAIGIVVAAASGDVAFLAATLLAVVTAAALEWIEPVSFFGRRWPVLPERALRASLAGLATFIVADGVGIVVGRQVHESFAASGSFTATAALTHNRDFSAEVVHPRLGGLRWGRETRFGQTVVDRETLQAVIDYLAERTGPFFVYPDCTFLYAVLDQPSPQPLLWFHRGLTYPFEYAPDVDRRIVAALEKQQVRTIVLEADAFGEDRNQLTDFPLVQQYVAENFDFDRRLGLFQLYVKREAAETTAAREPADRR